MEMKRLEGRKNFPNLCPKSRKKEKEKKRQQP
jgi:hypothetical protein